MNEIAQLLDTVIVECLDRNCCDSCPCNDNVCGCLWLQIPRLWDTDKMKKMIERLNNG